MYELRDLLRSYRAPEFKTERDLGFSESSFDCLQLDIRYGIKSICRLAQVASVDRDYSDAEAKRDLNNLTSLINSLMDITQFAEEQREDINYKLELMKKGENNDQL